MVEFGLLVAFAGSVITGWYASKANAPMILLGIVLIISGCLVTAGF